MCFRKELVQRQVINKNHQGDLEGNELHLVVVDCWRSQHFRHEFHDFTFELRVPEVDAESHLCLVGHDVQQTDGTRVIQQRNGGEVIFAAILRGSWFVVVGVLVDVDAEMAEFHGAERVGRYLEFGPRGRRRTILARHSSINS
jgi:hypothetical protein